MARWYNVIEFCVVYLSDVSASPDPNEWQSALRESAWFQRGWTLQELLFSKKIVFYDQQWSILRYLEKQSPLINEVTGIPAEVLEADDGFDARVPGYSIACSMSWASKRRTTRTEDEAYCLLGLFDINMPLLYGEGSKAFQRLQEAIIRLSSDESILAWT